MYKFSYMYFRSFLFDKALPTNHVRLPLLSEFNVGNNNIEGSLPMFDNVAQILFHSNTITGSIPTEYGLLGNLTELNLGSNTGVTGSLPTELVECDKLVFITIFGTGISSNVTFCDSSGDRNGDCLFSFWLYGEDYKYCCVTLHDKEN